MGLLLTRLYNLLSELGSSQPRRILMLGLDAAGKTTILYKLKMNEVVTTIPTIGFNVEEIKIGKGLTLTIWDVGGQEKIRRLWKHYFMNSHALVYVVDSNDVERLSEAKEELFLMIDSDDMKDKPVVVIANKQDLPNAMSLSQIVEGLELRKLEKGHKWHLQACCAITGDGLFEVMEQVGKLSTEYLKSRGSK